MYKKRGDLTPEELMTVRERRGGSTKRYRASGKAASYRKMENERAAQRRMKSKLKEARKRSMDETFERMKPELYKWANFFAQWDRYFEVDELVNVSFANGNLRSISRGNIKLLSRKVKWCMQSYMRKIRKQDPMNSRIIKDYVKKYGRTL